MGYYHLGSCCTQREENKRDYISFNPCGSVEGKTTKRVGGDLYG